MTVGRARLDEPVVAAVVVGLVARVPVLARGSVGARRRREVREHLAAVRVDIEVRQLAALTGQPVDVRAAGNLERHQPEQVVERVVLHHQDHDVLDLRDALVARRQVRKRSAVWPAQMAGRVEHGLGPGRKRVGREHRRPPRLAAQRAAACGRLTVPVRLLRSTTGDHELRLDLGRTRYTPAAIECHQGVTTLVVDERRHSPERSQPRCCWPPLACGSRWRSRPCGVAAIVIAARRRPELDTRRESASLSKLAAVDRVDDQLDVPDER